MKLKLQEINVTKIDGSKQKLALDYKGLANYIFNQTKDLGELELARELYKEGELEVDRETAIAEIGSFTGSGWFLAGYFDNSWG